LLKFCLGVPEEDGIPDMDEEEEEEEHVINETMFTFEAFEAVKIPAQFQRTS